MRNLIGVLALALLAGCSSPGDIKKNDPTISVSTNKTAKKYAQCVFPRWQDQRPNSTMSETENGYRLVVATDLMADEVLEVTATDSGSKVALFQRMPWSKMWGRGALEAAVRECL